MFVGVLVCTSAHTCVHAHIEARGQPGDHLHKHHFLPSRQSLFLAWQAQLGQASWFARPRDPHVSASPLLGPQAIPGFLSLGCSDQT